MGTHGQGMRLSLTHVADGEWQAYFMGENALLAPNGYGVAPSPWGAVQIAAWAAVARDAREEARRM